jgi:hypothetical protein
MKKILLLLFLSTASLFAENVLQFLEESKERKFWCFQDRQEMIEVEASLLYFTSTFSSPFSNELLLLNAALFPEFTDILDLKTASVDPEYNAGFQTELRYHIPSSNHLLIGSYRYIHNNADGTLKRNTITNSPDGMVQQNTQNDHGNEHVHLHTADLLLCHIYNVTKTALFYISAGLCFNDIHYHFTFHNNDQILNSNIAAPTVTPASTSLDLSGQRKTRIWGFGPKIAFGFEYNFLPLNWPHKLNFDVGFEFSMQFSKKWGRGKFQGQGTQVGNITYSTNFIRIWEDSPEFALLPNLNLDTKLEYQYCCSKTVILGLTVGYRILTFWDIYDLNREINYRMEKSQPVLAAQLREKDSIGFSGPYLSISFSY